MSTLFGQTDAKMEFCVKFSSRYIRPLSFQVLLSSFIHFFSKLNLSAFTFFSTVFIFNLQDSGPNFSALIDKTKHGLLLYIQFYTHFLVKLYQKMRLFFKLAFFFHWPNHKISRLNITYSSRLHHGANIIAIFTIRLPHCLKNRQPTTRMIVMIYSRYLLCKNKAFTKWTAGRFAENMSTYTCAKYQLTRLIISDIKYTNGIVVTGR